MPTTYTISTESSINLEKRLYNSPAHAAYRSDHDFAERSWPKLQMKASSRRSLRPWLGWTFCGARFVVPRVDEAATAPPAAN